MEAPIIDDHMILGQYKVIAKLDSVSNNCLYKVTKIADEDQKIYIMKVLPYDTEEEVENFKQEVKILEMLKNNPLFVKYEDQFEHIIDVEKEDYDGKYKYKKNYMFAVMEYYGNDLEKLAEHNKNGIDENFVVEFLNQALNALKVLGNKNIIHHDIKLSNFLVASENPWKFVLIDFEFAKQLNDGEKTSSGDGTSIFMAPEVLKEQPHGASADIWGVGVSAFRLATGVYPFKITLRDNYESVISKIENNNAIILSSRFKNKSAELRELLVKMLDKNQNQRITVEKALQSPLFDHCSIYDNEEEESFLTDARPPLSN